MTQRVFGKGRKMSKKGPFWACFGPQKGPFWPIGAQKRGETKKNRIFFPAKKLKVYALYIQITFFLILDTGNTFVQNPGRCIYREMNKRPVLAFLARNFYFWSEGKKNFGGKI